MSLQKTLARIKDSVQEGAAYEAQQQYKATFYRQKGKNNIQDSYTVLKEGAIVQLQHRNVTCGVELGLLLLEAYDTDGEPVTQDSVQRIEEMMGAFCPGACASDSSEAQRDVEECSRFVMGAIKWANKNGATSTVRRLHTQYARYLWNNYKLAQFGRCCTHLVRGDDPSLAAKVVSEASDSGMPGEADLFITRAVLQALAFKGKGTALQQQVDLARDLLNGFLTAKPQVAETPLGHFCSFLIQALDKHSEPLVELLKDKYAISLSVDGTFEGLMAKVTANHFPSRNAGGMGGLLGNLMQSLASMDEDADDMW